MQRYPSTAQIFLYLLSIRTIKLFFSVSIIFQPPPHMMGPGGPGGPNGPGGPMGMPPPFGPPPGMGGPPPLGTGPPPMMQVGPPSLSFKRL